MALGRDLIGDLGGGGVGAAVEGALAHVVEEDAAGVQVVRQRPCKEVPRSFAFIRFDAMRCDAMRCVGFIHAARRRGGK